MQRDESVLCSVHQGDEVARVFDFARQLEMELNEVKWHLALERGQIEAARQMERDGLIGGVCTK